MKILAAMSGGVDSAVATARMVEAGYDVVGVHMALSANPASERVGSRGCCSIEDSRDARRAADILGIPFYVWDLAEQFKQDVMADFVAEYAAGRTPNPCVRCNEKIKFKALLERALMLGFDGVATGHYAQVLRPEGAPVELHRAVDMSKDQSYVLAVMTSEQLAASFFPLGDTTKDLVRLEAAERGLLVADKPDSHDICFIADGDTMGFLRRELGAQPGEIVDTSGEVVGQHEGAYAYTVGQRKGLRLPRPAADGKPRYVLSIEPVNNRVVVGSASELDVQQLSATVTSWCGPQPQVGDVVGTQIRAHGQEISGRVLAVAGVGGQVQIELDQPERGVAAGQTLVLYRGSQVLGAATLN